MKQENNCKYKGTSDYYIPKFINQTDWTEENIKIIKCAIDNGIIINNEQLRFYIGNQSKKKLDNELTSASIVTNCKFNPYSKIMANQNEYKFYQDHTSILKTTPTILIKNFINFDKNNLTEEKNQNLIHANNSFTTKIYNYFMGKVLYECIDENKRIDDDKLIRQVETIMILRGEENKLFKRLQQKQNLSYDESHKKAEEKEQNNLEQLQIYLRYKDKFNELIVEAKNYKKYLKYKQKYIALKNTIKN